MTFSFNVAIIGPGRIGQALGRLLAQSRVPIAVVAGRQLSAATRGARFIGMGKPISVADLQPQSAAVFLITTSDSSLAEVASNLARQGTGKNPWRGKVVLHTCGSLPSGILSPLKQRGAAIGSLHPYQTVPSPRTGVRSLCECFWAVEGDRRAARVARDLIKMLQGTAFSVRPEEKMLYHLSAFLVCPTVVTLMAQSADLLKKAGVPPKISRPMLRQFVAETARNFADFGGSRALTGPAVRGDWTTICRHRAALRRSAPEFISVYESLLKAMLRLANKSEERGPKSKVPLTT